MGMGASHGSERRSDVDLDSPRVAAVRSFGESEKLFEPVILRSTERGSGTEITHQQDLTHQGRGEGTENQSSDSRGGGGGKIDWFWRVSSIVWGAQSLWSGSNAIKAFTMGHPAEGALLAGLTLLTTYFTYDRWKKSEGKRST